jgi:hypothetical protein
MLHEQILNLEYIIFFYLFYALHICYFLLEQFEHFTVEKHEKYIYSKT